MCMVMQRAQVSETGTPGSKSALAHFSTQPLPEVDHSRSESESFEEGWWSRQEERVRQT